MDTAQVAADRALVETVAMLTDTGLAAKVADLTGEVFKRNLERHEPGELGDTPTSFGVQCSENLKTLALRRFHGEGDEVDSEHWNVPGLKVATVRNSLMFEQGGRHVYVMKAPYAEGRMPRWDLFNWSQASAIRHSIAETNTDTLGGYTTTANVEDPLFDHPAKPRVVRTYLLVWAGDTKTASTAGWLTVPVLGQRPFVAMQPLWWDEEMASEATPSVRSAASSAPSFDQRAGATPSVVVRPATQEGGAS